MRYSKILVGVATMVAPVALSGGLARADSHNDPIRVRYDYNQGFSDFTDCPASVSVETDCIGSNVFAQTFKSKVGEVEREVTFLAVSMSVVHLHPGGTFDIGDLIASGQGTGDLEFEGVRSGRVKGEVAMSDGSTAKVRMSLAGTGPSTPYSGAGTGPESGCPSGSADISWTGTFRDALASGTLTVNGHVQTPTVARQPAGLLAERDKGTCTAI
jgi:hypothetical protein